MDRAARVNDDRYLNLPLYFPTVKKRISINNIRQ